MIVYNFEEYCENEKVNWTNVALGFSIVLYLVSHYGIPKSAAISYVNTQIENSKVVNVDTVSELNKAKEHIISKVNSDDIIMNKKEIIDSLNNIIFLSNPKFSNKVKAGGSYYHAKDTNTDYIFLLDTDYATIYHELLHYVDRKSKKSTDIGYASIKEIEYDVYAYRLIKFFDLVKNGKMDVNKDNIKCVNYIKGLSEVIAKDRKNLFQKNKLKEYIFQDSEIYVRINVFVDFLRDRKIIGDKITASDIDFMYSGKLFRNLSDDDKKYILNNPDVISLLPLITKENLEIINKII